MLSSLRILYISTILTGFVCLCIHLRYPCLCCCCGTYFTLKQLLSLQRSFLINRIELLLLLNLNVLYTCLWPNDFVVVPQPLWFYAFYKQNEHMCPRRRISLNLYAKSCREEQEITWVGKSDAKGSANCASILVNRTENESLSDFLVSTHKYLTMKAA